MVATRRKRAETKKKWRLACNASRFIAIMNPRRMQRFEEIPIEIRKIIVDKMRVEDRCRFARSSKLCETLAKESKYYMYGLKLCSSNPMKYVIKIHHNSPKVPGSRVSEDYSIEFERTGRTGRRNTMTVKIPTKTKTWIYLLPKNTNILEAAVEKFEKLVNANRKVIRCLDISCKELADRQFNFSEITRLERLEQEFLNPGVVQMFPYPLKTLYLGQTVGAVTLDSLGLFDHVCRVQNMLSLDLNVTFEQLIQFNAERIFATIEGWRGQDLFNLITLWKNGNDPRKRWFSLGIRYNAAAGLIQELLSLLNLRITDTNTARIRLYDQSLSGKSAKLQFMADGVFFAYPYDAYDLCPDERDYPQVDFVRVI